MKRSADKIFIKHKLGLVGFSCYACFAAASFLGSGVCFIIAAIAAALFIISLAVWRMLSAKGGAAVFLVILSCSVFFLLYGIYTAAVIERCRVLNGTEVEVTARVTEVSRYDSDTVLLTAERVDGFPLKFSIFTADTGVTAGDIITADMKFYAPVEAAEFNEASYSYSRGIFVSATAASGVTVTGHTDTGISGLVNDFSARLKAVAERYLTGDEGGLVKAMFFGDKSGLSAEALLSVRNCGLFHMTAVSGMHLTLIVSFAAIAMDICGLRHRNKLKFGVTAALVLLLMCFFGFTASVRRSGLMMIMYYGSLPLRRRTSPLDSLGGAVLIILLIEPFACRDIGLLMSVCATFGLNAFADDNSVIYRRRSAVISSLASALGAILCTLPVSALFFGGVSTVSPIVSLVCYPLFALIITVMVLFCLTGGLLAEPLLLTAGLLAKVFKAIIDLVAGLRYSYISFDGTPAVYIILIALIYVIAVAVCLQRKSDAAKAAAISVCMLALVLAADKALYSGAAQAAQIAQIAIVRVYSDGERGMMTIKTEKGVTLLCAGGSGKLYKYAVNALSDAYMDRYLLAAVTGKDKSDVYFEGFKSIPAIENRGSENAVYDIGGEYTVECKNGVFTADIYGVKVTLAPAGTTGVVSDFVIYSGYKKAYGNDGITKTVFCDKRYPAETDGAVNAYYQKTGILIDNNGNYRERR